MVQFDIIICVGPNDAKNIKTLVNNIKEYLTGLNKIWLIMPTNILEKYRVYDYIVENIDENIFPFNKKYIDDLFKCPERSGWYLQQLLKIYAPIILENMLDNYIIIDADLKFYNKVTFFEDNKLLFNTDNSGWTPYFIHLNKLCPQIEIKTKVSGITNLMPMKRHIVQSLIKMVENYHNMDFWNIFLNLVDPVHYSLSGASEYEILFNYSLTFFNNECIIRPIKYKNSDKFTYNKSLIYEACQTNK
jgi:hypothetical protein